MTFLRWMYLALLYICVFLKRSPVDRHHVITGSNHFKDEKKRAYWKRHWYYVHIMRKLRFDDVHHMELIPMYTNRKPCGNTDSLRPSVKRINGWYVSRKLHPSFIILGISVNSNFKRIYKITVELNQ